MRARWRRRFLYTRMVYVARCAEFTAFSSHVDILAGRRETRSRGCSGMLEQVYQLSK